MLSILWSDRNDIIIYRTYDSFKDLSKQLARKFPLESGLVNKSERILPILRDVPLWFRTRFSSRYMERLRLVQAYSQELLQTDSKISQCEDIIQYFSPNSQDLTPSFPENSLVILPSESDQKQEVTIPRSDQPTSQPILSEPYLCIDAYETKDTKNRPFKVKKNEQIDVIIKDSTGWWLVENEEKCLAWFPAPYLVKPISAENNSKKKSFHKGSFYYAHKAFEAQNVDEIALKIGVVVEVIEKSDDGWWLICYNGRFGYTPAMFLKPYKNPHQNLQVTHNLERFGSTPNLFNAVNGVQNDRSPEQPRQRREEKIQKPRLQKTLSRSLSGLQDLDIDEPDFSTPTRARIDSSKPRESYVEWCKQDLWTAKYSSQTPHPAHPLSPNSLYNCNELSPQQKLNKPEFEEEKHRKDSGFDEQRSPSTSVSSDGDKIPPLVPQRPSLQEIQSRCTSITRNAALQHNI
ncbi:NADPH oxidase organizer 1-like isoform X2 [Hyperolius riggenbachi]